MPEMDKVDKALLDMLQHEFPLTVKPYREVAARLYIEEEEVLQRITKLKKTGVIRRIGAVLDARSLGFYTVLCACHVSPARVSVAAEAINCLDGVTHNYVRQHHYNIWFTLAAPSKNRAMSIIRQLEEDLNTAILLMPALKTYKINATFEMGEEHK